MRKDRHCHRCQLLGIKCDLNRPSCQSCRHERASCNYPRRLKWMDEHKSVESDSTTAHESISTEDTASTSSKGSPSGFENMPINLHGFIDMLSHFYREIQSSKQDLPNETIQLISRTLNFAQSRLKGSGRRSIQSHLVALANLSQVIESGHPIALFGIATFAIFEVCCGSFGQWHRHLHGARSLLDLHAHSRTDIDKMASQMPGLIDVLVYLLWFDVTGALIRESDLIFDDWHRELMSHQFLDSVGCPPDTFELLAHLSKRNITPDIKDASCRAMEQIMLLDSGDISDRGLASLVYRCAAAMGALGTLSGSEDEHPSSSPCRQEGLISQMVDRVCAAISKTPPSSRFYVHLATPAYITSMHASKKYQCDILRFYWRNCQISDFPRYPDAQEQCEAKWRKRAIA